MSSKKMPLPVVETESGNGDSIVRADINFSDSEYNTNQNCSQAVAGFLRRGIENAISTKELVRLTGCGSSRQLQTLIAQEREQGAVILSSSIGGYFLPADGAQGRQEIQAYIATLRARAINTLRALHSAKAALAVMEGQMEVLNDG